MPPRARLVGVGLRDKRARLLRSLDAHLRWLRVAETLAPWVPPSRAERPPRPPDLFPYRADMRGRKWSPRERPELARPGPGPEAISDEQIAAYVGTHPELNPAAALATVRALTFIETFRPSQR